MSMKCIQFHSSFPSNSMQKQLVIKKQALMYPSSQQFTSPIKHGQRISIRANYVLTNIPLILAESSPHQGGDISVLLPTGGVLLLAYGIANYVVPAFIIKSYDSDEESKDSPPKK
ncbi:uncharacterized protein LOC126669141 [Mercurialis annua]|uniref:uncharacterized protein LOC126669141 n=1 Tax=Mercurialis annua TaxID=3986 RepID=UPI00215EE900|nr:uncharacterized protein LOC126669141 [Mercurialis annua]